MFVPRKPHTFGNDYHTFACAKYKVIYNVKIVEGKYLVVVVVVVPVSRPYAMSEL